MTEYEAAEATKPTQQSINALLKRITRVRVVPLENYRLGATDLKTLLDTSDAASLASLRQCFAIVEDPKTFGICMCLGNPHFEFYAGDQLVAKISYHHGFSIRWDAWKYDAWLKEPERLLDWLSERGVDGPRREVEELKRRSEESHQQAERWLEVMPACLRPFWKRMEHSSSPELHRQLLEEYQAAIPDQDNQVLVLFGWFGSGAGPWSEFPSYESVPEYMLLAYPTQVLINVLTTSTPTETQWRGAARYFGGWEFRHTKKRDKKLLSSVLKQRLLQSAHATGIADAISRAEAAFNR